VRQANSGVSARSLDFGNKIMPSFGGRQKKRKAPIQECDLEYKLLVKKRNREEMA
jgi:hypothetical protein